MKYFLSGLLLLVAVGACAQNADTLFISRGLTSAKSIHTQRIRSESLLYNGVAFDEYQPLDDEYPYLHEDWVSGTLRYDEQDFDSVYLRYDLYTDNLQIENYNFGATIQLIRDRVEHFTLGNRAFILADDASLSKGFYEVLYDGPTRTLAKRKKDLQEWITSSEITHDFTQKNKYYIFKDQAYHQVSTKKSVLSLFGDRKQEVNKKFRDRKIKFRKNKEKAIVTMVELYDTVKD
jgi:hypothetical protein